MPRAAESSATTLRDLQLTIQVRRALTGDETLAPLSIGVRVEKGVATLWGPAPSAAAAMRCLTTAKTVPGLDEVRSEMWIAPSAEAIVGPFRPPQDEKPKRTDAAPGRLTACPADESPPATSGKPQSPVRLALPQFGAQAAEGAQEESGNELIEAFSRLRKKEERFGQLDAALRGDSVIVTGFVNRAADLIDFEQALRALPGVRQIDTDAVRLAPLSSSITLPNLRETPQELRIRR
jgi:BON domain